MVIRLPETKSEQIFINQAVGVIKVIVPEGNRIAVDAQNGLSRVVFPSDFELEDGYYASPKTTVSNADFVIVIEQAVGMVTVEYSR
jgi:predicted membrane protein